MMKQKVCHAFAFPQKYRNLFLEKDLKPYPQKRFIGKSFICVSLTRFCPVGCEFCFFKSGNPFQEPTEYDRFSQAGCSRFIAFANQVNLGYLLVSGGGEPLMERRSVLRIVQEVISDRIVLVTSGNWAVEKELAKAYLNQLVFALQKRTSPTNLTVRLSFDQGHSHRLGLWPAIHLIQLFQETFHSVKNLSLQLHTFVDDLNLKLLISYFESQGKHVSLSDPLYNIAEGESALKNVPKQVVLTIDGFAVSVGMAKLFHSDLLADLSSTDLVQRNLKVFQKDLLESEEGNPSVVRNRDGEEGLDFWVNYNGNVTTWGNQYPDRLFNIHFDDAKTVIDGSLKDIAAYSMLERGGAYRDSVIAKVNPIAVLRGKVVNIRDYTAALMFDEARTRLYYTVAVIRDYLQSGQLSEKIMQRFKDPVVHALLSAPEDLLIQAYQNARCTIVEETMALTFDQKRVSDILTWIRLHHYQISSEKAETLLDYYNAHVPLKERFQNISEARLHDPLQIVRMTEYLTGVKDTLVHSQVRMTSESLCC